MMKADPYSPSITPPEVIDAQKAVDELMEKLTRGETVTAPQLANARGDVELAVFKAEARERRQAQDREDARAAILETLKSRAAAELKPDALDAPRAEMRSAIDKFVAAAKAYDELWDDIAAPLLNNDLSPLPRGLSYDAGGTLHVDGRTYPHSSAPRDIADAAHVVLRNHFPRRSIDLKPSDWPV